MRETRNAQCSIFDVFSKHELGQRLRRLSELLDDYPDILALVERDFDRENAAHTGACGLTFESIFRCLILKQITGLSYKHLAFHLSDSPTYRAFARLKVEQAPSKSGHINFWPLRQ